MQGGKGEKVADTLRLEPDLVRRFVNDAHGDLASVGAMLGQQPALIDPLGTGAAAIGRPDWVQPRTWEGGISLCI